MKQLFNYTLLRWKAFIDIDEITTINWCTRDITGHLQVLNLRESMQGTEVRGRFNIAVRRQV